MRNFRASAVMQFHLCHPPILSVAISQTPSRHTPDRLTPIVQNLGNKQRSRKNKNTSRQNHTHPRASNIQNVQPWTQDRTKNTHPDKKHNNRATKTKEQSIEFSRENRTIRSIRPITIAKLPPISLVNPFFSKLICLMNKFLQVDYMVYNASKPPRSIHIKFGWAFPSHISSSRLTLLRHNHTNSMHGFIITFAYFVFYDMNLFLILKFSK